MNQSKLRIFSISLVALLLVTSSGLVFGSWYLKRLEESVTSKFEGPKWRFPSKIYSDSYLLYVGINLRVDEFKDKLRRLGYRETQAPPRAQGEYRYRQAPAVLQIYLHDFVYPAEAFKGFPVRISFQGSAISKIENDATGEEMFSLELEPELVTGLYDRTWQERRVVKLAEVPPLVVKAILAIEDERFYQHHGIDPVSVLRAVWVNMRSGGVVQGGSTLTQQLMKNFFLGDERTLKRKIKEALMALVAERKYTKAEILENYLNEIYLGQRGSQGIYGVWEAAQFYFSKRLNELTVGEAALLAGLIRAPNRLSPYRSVDAALKRRNVVLAKLVDDKIITTRQYEAALREKLPRRELIKVTNDAPFYVDFLRRELSENYSNSVLTAEGLRIFTSLDLQLQRIAERTLSEGLKKLEEGYPNLRRKGEDDSLEGAIIVLRPQTGEIKAMIGGRSYQMSQFNRVFQAKRQPGSVFKPFVYLAALMSAADGGKKFTPSTMLEDSPFVWNYEGQEWQPGNYNDEYFGAVTLRRALEKSLNSATARVARDVGIARVRDIAHRLGIQSSLPAVPSLALGAAEVTPLEVAVAFSTLANNGVRTRPLTVKQVMDANARVLEKRDVRVEKVISPQLAFMMNNLLKGVVDRGTGEYARRWGFTRPAAGKTGTTNDYKDAWFVGYTPDLLAVVWVGFDNQTKLGLSGAQAALPIWTEFMKRATAGTPVTDFVPPPGIKIVDIDPLSGQLATPSCPTVLHEAFIEGDEPTVTVRSIPARHCRSRSPNEPSFDAMNFGPTRNLFIGGLAAGVMVSFTQSCAPRPPYRAPAPPPASAPSISKPTAPVSPPPAQETVRKPLPQESKIKEQDVRSKPLPPPQATKETPKEPHLSTESVAPALPDDSSLLAKITQGTSPQRAASLRLTEEGRKLLDAGDAAKALTRLEKTIVIDSTNPYGYFYLAKAQYHLRQYKESLNFLDVAESRLTGEPFWLAEVQALRGENYRALGMTQKAEASYAQALRLNSGNRTALEALSRLHESQPASR